MRHLLLLLGRLLLRGLLLGSLLRAGLLRRALSCLGRHDVLLTRESRGLEMRWFDGGCCDLVHRVFRGEETKPGWVAAA